MLRFLYQCVLRAHPSCFRRRFADEMLSIFDHTEGTLAAEQTGERRCDLVAADGRCVRNSGKRPRPRPLRMARRCFTPSKAASLGLELCSMERSCSLLVLNGVCWTMGYAWNHPTFVWIQQPVPSATLVEPGSSRSSGHARDREEFLPTRKSLAGLQVAQSCASECSQLASKE